jgi:hypothetical protein
MNTHLDVARLRAQVLHYGPHIAYEARVPLGDLQQFAMGYRSLAPAALQAVAQAIARRVGGAHG